MVGGPDIPSDVAAAYGAYAPVPRAHLLALRTQIYEVAAADPVVGPLTEALRWGEPAYLTKASKSGTTLRLGVMRSAPDIAALFLNCRTTLIEELRAQFPDRDVFDGNRAILIRPDGEDVGDVLAVAVPRALRYHKPNRPTQR